MFDATVGKKFHMNPETRRNWRRRLKWPAIVLGGLGVVLYLIVPLVATPMIRDRLQKMISTQLNAELKMGNVTYLFPYGVTVSDAVLVGKDERGEAVELLKIPKLKLALAKLPFGEGPLVIRKLMLERPAIRLIHTEHGLVGRKTLVKPQEPPDPSKRWEKVSEMFELRRFAIEGGVVIYEDRQQPQTVPTAWRNIDVDLTTTPSSNPIYEFDLKVTNGELAQIRAEGSFNVDELDLVVGQIAMKLNLVAGAKESPLPAGLQTMLLNNNLSGKLDVTGKAKAPLKRMEDAQFDFQAVLGEGAARISKWHSDGDNNRTTLDRFSAKLRCSSEPLTEAHELLATAGALRGAETRPATQPATHSTSPPSTAPATTQAYGNKVPAAYLLVEEAEIVMGDNLLSVKNATAAYDRRLHEWQVKQARGTLRLGKQKEDLPKPLRAATEKPQFFGTVELVLDGQGSWIKPEPVAKRPFQINLSARCPELTMLPRKLVANDVVVTMLITPGLVQFVSDTDGRPGISATLYGGKLTGHGAIRTGKPARYELAGAAENVDLRAFARDWGRGEEKLSKLSGRGFAALQLAGATSHEGRKAIDLLTAEGTVEILDGELYDLPILEDIASIVALNKDAGKVGQAAGRIAIADRMIHFKRVAVAAPILGIQGDGKAGFDGKLDFSVVAAPLSDWKKQLQKSSIPLLDSVGAELVGGIQNILNSASGKLLYQFRITGNVKKPVVAAEAVPILSEDGMKLLKDMLKGTGRLLDSL
jgi:hypothetical protein